MAAVVLLTGIIGSTVPYCINGFEDMAIGPISGSVVLLGEADSGALAFEAAEFGSR